MAITTSHLPHPTNVKAAMERWDPMHQSIFAVIFSVPFVLRGEYDTDQMSILSQQIISIDGLDGLQKTVGFYTQKYLGVDVAFYNPKIDNTTVDFNINFNLNIRNYSEAYVYNLFREWFSLLYDMPTGVRALKDMACAETMVILEANRDGTIWRQVTLYNVICTSMTGLNSLNYSTSDPREVNIGFHADYWEETIG